MKYPIKNFLLYMVLAMPVVILLDVIAPPEQAFVFGQLSIIWCFIASRFSNRVIK